MPALGFDRAISGDDALRLRVFARIVEPTTKLDLLRFRKEVGVDPPAYATPKRRLPVFASDSWRGA